MMKRRDALKTIGGLAGAAGLAKFLPACGDSDDGPVGITTYVYLMLENRTYDHVLGARKLEGLPGDGLTAGLSNPDMNGTLIAPYMPNREELCVLDPPHDWDASHLQFNSGAMDGFVTEHQKDHSSTVLRDPMQYLDRTYQPISWALADAYTTCDRWFASVMGPTLPNRAYWHTATSFGLKANNDVLDKFASVPVPTIYNRLQDSQVDWAYYFGNLAVVALLGSPGPFQIDLGPNDGTGHIRRFGDPAAGGGQFFKDAAAGKLPPVVYIDPSFSENDDHPPVHPIRAQALIAAVYTALAKSPQWKNCMLVVTYDEHGGFYDHVAPPVNPSDDTLAKFGVDGFQQLGFRVPTMVAGPYAKQAHVSSVQYDHTSARKHLQNAFGLEPLNARMDAANDLTDCIDMDRLARGEWAPPAELPEINLDDWAWEDMKCKSAGGFRHADPISQWADKNPGKLGGEYDLRDADPEQRAVREFLRKHQRSR
jgi:phospholipase C